MDIYSLVHRAERKIKLALLFAVRIVGAPDHFHCPLPTRLRANFSGGFTGDQWKLYGLDGKKRREYLSEFDWYRSRYVNAPFDYMLNNKVVATEVLEKYIRVPEIYAIRTGGVIRDRSGQPMDDEGALALLREKGQVIITRARARASAAWPGGTASTGWMPGPWTPLPPPRPWRPAGTGTCPRW